MENLLNAPIDRPRHIPSLDGVRALSVFLVMALHSLQRFNVTHHVALFFFILLNGEFGVFIFFVISGFLITTLLLKEREKTGRISLRSFYVRRGFRILPPLYVYILFIAIVGHFHRIENINRYSLFTAFTLTSDYIHWTSSWAFEHFWSLCIEEQFYLLWPASLAFCLIRIPGERGKIMAARIALTVICVEPFVRVLYFFFTRPPRYFGMFHLMADGLMFGALGALLQGHTKFEEIYRRATRWPWLLPVFLFAVLGTFYMRYQHYFDATVGSTLESFVILMWLLWLVRNPGSWQGRVFNQRIVTWIGRLSYSLYLWQTFFLNFESIRVFGGETIFNTFPLNWVSVLVVAVLSYYLLEQPSLRLRDRVLAKLHWHEV